MSAWTEDHIRELRRRWPLGHSAAAIASDLGAGLSRDAVVSQVRRLHFDSGGRRRRDGEDAPASGSTRRDDLNPQRRTL